LVPSLDGYPHIDIQEYLLVTFYIIILNLNYSFSRN
jgi:hypothetical protein